MQQKRALVAITGWSGFVGSGITDAFLRAGCRVIGLSRHAGGIGRESFEWRPYDLASPIETGDLRGVDILVHCAYDANSPCKNKDGTRRLIEAARLAGVGTVVYISSMASSEDARTRYGRDKHDMESLLDLGRDIVVRPGLVAGPGGLYGAMHDAVARFRFAPIFDGGRQPVYLVARDELAAAIVTIALARANGLYLFAGSEPIALDDLYSAIAASARVRLRRIALPLKLTLRLAAVLERCGIALPISPESLRGIMNLKTMDIPTYERFGITFSDAASVVVRAAAA